MGTIQNMKFSVKAILYCFVLFLVATACVNVKNDPVPVQTAQITFYHGSPNAPGLHATVDNREFLPSALNYTDYTGYRDFWEGTRNFKFNIPSSSIYLIDTTFNIHHGESYSIFVIEPLSGIKALLITDSADAPATGKAMIRFVHLSPDAAPVNIDIGDQNNFFSDVAFKKATAFVVVDADTTTIQLKDASTSDVLSTSTNVVIAEGKYYTIITRGFQNPPEGNTNNLNIQVVENN
jgi:hypothetical protein